MEPAGVLRASRRPASSRPGAASRRFQRLLPPAVAGLASLGLTSLVLELWHADFRVPLAYSRDALANLIFVKETLEQGWPLHNPMLGAPFGQDLHDFPVVAGDSLHLLIIKFFGIFTGDVPTVMNLFFLAQFPIIALAALWALRRLGTPTWPAVACAVLFTLAPYHFYRGEIHLFLAGYWGVPLGLYLVLRLFMGHPLARRRGEAAVPTGPLSWAGLALLCVLIGMSEVYYAAMTLILIGAGTLVALLRPDWRRLAVTAAAAAAIIGATVAAAHAPTIIYHARHGQNAEVQKARDPGQSEQYGIKLTRLVLPVDDHRLAPLASLARRYERQAPPQLDESAPQALGTLATAGLLALILLALLAIVPGSRRLTPTPLLGAAAAATVVALLVGTSGGFSGVLSYFIVDSIRSWNRYSIFIGFLALLPLALVLDRLRPAMARRGLGAAKWAAALVAVVVIGLLDQTGKSLVPPYKALSKQWNGEASFVHAVESRLPRGAAIYETPYFPFPEWGYELAAGYLHSDHLRWSFGAMEGRPADWSRALLSQPGNVIIPSVASAGFAGLYVDRRQYRDNGAGADKELRRDLGAPLVISGDRRFELYDLQPYATRVRQVLGEPAAARLAALTLHPPRAIFGSAWGAALPQDTILAESNERWSNRPSASFDLYNPSSVPRPARLQAGLVAQFDAKLAIGLPTGELIEAQISANPVEFDREILLKPGHNTITLSSDLRTNPNRKKYIGIANFRLMDENARRLAVRASKALD